VWWLATVAAVALGLIAIIALVATALGMRGATKPLRTHGCGKPGDRMRRRSVAGARDWSARDQGPGGGLQHHGARTSRAQEAEQSFLLSVSHELKTPLTAIQGYGETLTEGRADRGPPAR